MRKEAFASLKFAFILDICDFKVSRLFDALLLAFVNNIKTTLT